ncbi:MAG TPA: AAA family ATPase [Candidatus Saccharimonadales bacterium]|nr:AAA family ATPase [Candidatus Saccharimonadales bacterium]
MKIIGIAGTNGSGKDTVGQILETDYGYLFVSVTDILRNELKKQDKPIVRENMRELGDRWRREYGLSVLIDKAVEIYSSKQQEYKGLVIASIRNVGEVEHIHGLGGIVIWVDAAPKVRYQRAIGRSRSDEDAKTYEEFLREEQDEMNAYGDEASLAMNEVKKLCDLSIENNSDDKKVLEDTVSQAVRNALLD